MPAPLSMRLQVTTAVAFVAVIAMVEARPRVSREVTGIRYWSLADKTRVSITIKGDVHYRSDRVRNPNRIFVDIVGARPYIKGQRSFSTDVGDNLLNRIRVAETSPGVTRVVLDLESDADFAVLRRNNPRRLIIELRPSAVTRSSAKPVRPAHLESQGESRVETNDDLEEAAQVRRELGHVRERPELPQSKPDVAETPVSRMNSKATPEPSGVHPEPPMVAVAHGGAPDDAPTDASLSPTAPAVRTAARPAGDGERSRIRALELKINRVVIDPGHGGSDLGTVGRRGLMEKELVLDVARRLGRLIEERMGSEVIYTRTDDTLVPLRARTEIANEKRADLFLSIHANSSAYVKIDGIEVYYLNFTHSPDALDVAARENASSENSVFELRDLIRTITMHDKIEQSREFAVTVQSALQRFEIGNNTTARNRGVEMAPFVVLIGASMPSILAEIGFLSNLREAKLLGRVDHRQHLAEALYQGISRFAQSPSHFQISQHASSEQTTVSDRVR